MRNRKAKATLFGASLFAVFTIWAVHYQQQEERAVRDEIQVSPNDLLTIIKVYVSRCTTR